MLGRRKLKVRAAVMPPPDPALDAARQHLADICRAADERIERVLQKLRAAAPKEES